MALSAFIAALCCIALLYMMRAYSIVARSASTYTYLFDFKMFYGGIFDYFKGGDLYHMSAHLPFQRCPTSANNNSPVGALIFLLLSRFPLPVAGGIWQGLSLVLLVCTIFLIWRVFPTPRQWYWRAAILVFVFVSEPVSDALLLGTWGMVIAFLDVAVWYCARKGYERRAGLLLGLVLILRWQPSILALFFIAQRRWRLLAYSAISLAVSCSLALAIFGLRSFITFGRVVLASTGWADNPWDSSLRSFLDRLFDALALRGIHLNGVATGIWLACALALVVLTLRRCRALPFDDAYSLCLVAGLLLVQMSWVHYHMAVLLPMMVSAQRHRFLPILYTSVFWLSADMLSPGFVTNPLLYGALLTCSIFGLYWALYQGPPNQGPPTVASRVSGRFVTDVRHLTRGIVQVATNRGYH